MRRFSLLLSVLLLLLTTSVFAADPTPRGAERALDREPGRHLIVSPAHPLSESERNELRAAGIELQHPLAGGRFLARVAPGAKLDDARIAATAPMTLDEKILRSAQRQLGQGRAWANLQIIFHDDVSFEDARAAVLATGGGLVDVLATEFAGPHRLAVRVTPSSVPALAADDRVLAIGGAMRQPVAFNKNSAALSHVPEAVAAYNLSGEGVTVSVSELAESQWDHIEFEGRSTFIPPPNRTSPKNDFHSTHVQGTIGAAGLRPEAKGMAPKVRIFQLDVQGDITRFLQAKGEDIPKLGVVADNNSIGVPHGWCDSCDGAGFPVWLDDEEYYGSYNVDEGTSSLDDYTLQHKVLYIFASGNSADLPLFERWGQHRHVDDNFDAINTKLFCVSLDHSGKDCPTFDCTGGCELTQHHTIQPFDTTSDWGSAKNVLSVGAVTTLGSRVEIVPFSSRGPAKDGRIKPDVVARGFQTLSTVPVNSYGLSSGTSMSTPAVTGIVALLTEAWKRTHGGTNPLPWQTKAVVIAGVTDIGNPGPDYTYGCGIVDAKNSADLIFGDNGKQTQIRNATITQGQQYEMAVTVGATQNLRVVANWPDPSALLLGNDAFTKPALVNDLDLKVIGPDGATALPYVLNKDQVNANATRGVNVVDNVEMVEIPNAAPGVYRIVVSGSRVTQGPQDVVIVSNAPSQPVVVCSTAFEPNDSEAAAFGNLFSGTTINAALCSQSDVDFYRFIATDFGNITVNVTASGDTAIRVTATASNGQTATTTVAAGASGTLTLPYTGTGRANLPVVVRIEPSGTVGSNATYTMVPRFGTATANRPRAVRH